MKWTYHGECDEIVFGTDTAVSCDHAAVPSQDDHNEGKACRDDGRQESVISYMCRCLRRKHKPARGVFVHREGGVIEMLSNIGMQMTGSNDERCSFAKMCYSWRGPESC